MTDPFNDGDRAPISASMRSVENSIPVESPVPVSGEEFVSTEEVTVSEVTVSEVAVSEVAVSGEPVVNAPAARASTVDKQTNDLRSPIQLYEERLVTQTRRIKTGEVKISKRIVTDSASADIPVTREKIIIEIESIYSGETRLDIGDAETAEDGSIRMGIYEEQALSCRRIVPYQNVSVRKETVIDTVTAQEMLRREEIEITTEGSPLIEEKFMEEKLIEEKFIEEK